MENLGLLRYLTSINVLKFSRSEFTFGLTRFLVTNKSQESVAATASSPIVPEVPWTGSLQDLKLTSIGGNHQQDFVVSPVANANAEEIYDYRDNPDAEREVLEGIDESFFKDDYDAARYEIEVSSLETDDFGETIP